MTSPSLPAPLRGITHHAVSHTKGYIAAVLSVIVAVAALVHLQPPAKAATDPLPNRPYFYVPFTCNATAEIKTYVGHNPDDKKMDIYQVGKPTDAPILASAAGYVHESFEPGGIEIDHGNGWFTTYMHMKARIAVGTTVKAGQWVGTMGDIGGNGVVHLHHEQLYAPGRNNADNGNIVNPKIQGNGPMYLTPGNPVYIKSTNCGGTPPPPTGPSTYLVDTYANAPGYDRPGGKKTGTLNAGTSYVYCKAWGPNVTAGASYNHWWMKTDLDVGPANQWVSALYLSRWGNDIAKANDGRELPNCYQPYGTIGKKYTAMGGANSILGQPVTPEMDSKAGGRFQQFERGIIIWRPDVAFAIYGDILTRFWALGAESVWGFPTMDEMNAARSPIGTVGRYQYFQKGLFLWSAPTGAKVIKGAILAKFETSGREKALGYPTTEEIVEGTGFKQIFQSAVIHWNPTRGAWITK